VLDQLALIFKSRLMLLELFDGPQVIAAQELKGRLQDVSSEAVRGSPQVPLLGWASRDDTGLAGAAYYHAVQGIV
jgi:hypothetical protein